MRLSKSFFLTRRENPSTEYSDVSKLLIKSGMVIRNDGGIYSYLPMGLRVIKNIENIIKDELNNLGCEELLLPTLVKDNYDNENMIEEVFHLIDRNNNKMKLTHSSSELFLHS